MASNYNHVPRPAVVSVNEDRGVLVLLRRENIDYLLALDPGPIRAEVPCP
jgi:diaminopimelate decarboxylase